MSSIARRALVAAAAGCLLAGCAATRLPIPPEQLEQPQALDLRPDEALVVVKLNYLGADVNGGTLNFHHDGPQEFREGFFVRQPEDMLPMFSIPTSLSGRALVYKVKAGRFSFTQFNRGMYIGDLGKSLNAYAKAQTITYVGDIELRLEDRMRFSYRVVDNAATPRIARNRYWAVFDKYPSQTYLLKQGL